MCLWPLNWNKNEGLPQCATLLETLCYAYQPRDDARKILRNSSKTLLPWWQQMKHFSGRRRTNNIEVELASFCYCSSKNLKNVSPLDKFLTFIVYFHVVITLWFPFNQQSPDVCGFKTWCAKIHWFFRRWNLFWKFVVCFSAMSIIA